MAKIWQSKNAFLCDFSVIFYRKFYGKFMGILQKFPPSRPYSVDFRGRDLLELVGKAEAFLGLTLLSLEIDRGSLWDTGRF